MAHSGAKGIAKFSAGKFDLVICDYRLGDMEGIKVLTTLRQQNPGVKVLMITGYSDIKTAVEVIKLGAFDYIVKPLIPDEVLSVINKTIQQPSSGAADTNAGDSGKKGFRNQIILVKNL